MSTTRRLFLGAGITSVYNASAYNTGQKVRIGIVGGNFGAQFQWHLDPDCSVVAVCDIRPDRLEKLQKVYACQNPYQQFSRMLNHPGLNAVALFTPAPDHVSMAVQALKAGKHVISAVPAGLSLDELELLLETVKSTGLRYMMAETSFYRPQIITCRAWAAEKKFGTIFHSEAEYHHFGLDALYYEQGKPTWRLGLPPMLYPTHCVGMVVPVTGERLTEVSAIGWGGDFPELRVNGYDNPFSSETAFFKTSGGHSSRIAISWRVAAGGTERATFYGDRMSYVMGRPEGSPDVIFEVNKDGKLSKPPYQEPNHLETLPEPMRVKTAHGSSHPFLTHEFVRAIVEDRHPAVNIWEAIAYTAPGIVAHQSALRGGEHMKIKDFGRAI